MLLRSWESRGASERLRREVAGGASPMALLPDEVALKVSAAGLLIPNCPDMNTCAAVPSWDLSCWPRDVTGVATLEPLGVIDMVADSSPWQEGVPEKFIPR